MAGCVITTKFRWIDEQPIGTSVSVCAPSQGFRSFPCTVVAVGGKDDEDVQLGFPFLNTNPFPPGTEIQISVIDQGAGAQSHVSGHRVIAIGVTL